MRSLTRDRTWTKGSPPVAFRAESASSKGLPRASPRCARSDRAAFARPALPCPSSSCNSAAGCANGAAPGERCRAIGAARTARAASAGAAASRCRVARSPTSLLLTLYKSPMPCRIPIASVMAVISAALVWDRWSQAWALAWQFGVSSCKNAWSALLAAVSSANSPSFVLLVSLFSALIFCFWSISAWIAATDCARAPSSMLWSCSAEASSASTLASSALKVLLSDCSVAIMSVELYW
mmetsp:Transcript_51590/g.160035  ORF Transcript_51590/g.160035 Transcript_51590/m.160035 type:complete len:238 (-) Transcript_51590:580-1293(-)